jgi:hypothetical protein
MGKPLPGRDIPVCNKDLSVARPAIVIQLPDLLDRARKPRRFLADHPEIAVGP